MSRPVKFAGKFVILMVLATALQGCVPEMVMNSMDHQHYSDYVVKTEQLNLKLQKAGFPPNKIMTFKEWKGK